MNGSSNHYKSLCVRFTECLQLNSNSRSLGLAHNIRKAKTGLLGVFLTANFLVESTHKGTNIPSLFALMRCQKAIWVDLFLILSV
jgi:hypothetical protein